MKVFRICSVIISGFSGSCCSTLEHEPESEGRWVDELTHLDERGRARMVNGGEKPITHRVCVARGEVRMAADTLARIVEGRVAKGDVLATARIAGIQAAKRAGDWIPLAHPMPIDAVEVDLEPSSDGLALLIEARVEISRLDRLESGFIFFVFKDDGIEVKK